MSEIITYRPDNTHKTDGIEKTEWREKVLTVTEQIRNDKAMEMLDIDMSWLAPGIVGLNDDIDIVAYPQLTPIAGFKYIDGLRTTYKAYNDAKTLSVNNPALQMGVFLQSITGLLDFPERKDTIILGVPLQ